jgi:hypothetical protein
MKSRINLVILDNPGTSLIHDIDRYCRKSFPLKVSFPTSALTAEITYCVHPHHPAGLIPTEYVDQYHSALRRGVDAAGAQAVKQNLALAGISSDQLGC